MNSHIMRQNNRFCFVLLTACSLLGIPSMLVAQQAKRPMFPAANNQPAGKSSLGKAAPPAAENPPAQQAAGKKPRPAAQNLQICVVPPELEKILIKWETESAKIKSLHGKHTRKEYNDTFKVEKVSEGEFFLETPDKGRIDMMAKTPKKGEVGSRKDSETLESYALEKGPSERWICTGEEIISFNEDDKTYVREELPPSMRGKNIVHSPLPFLFGMKAEDAKNRFNLTLVSVGEDIVRLKVIPRMDSDRQNYHEAHIILDTKTYTPKAVQLIDPNGLETCYYFKNVVPNDGNFAQRLVGSFRENPYKPSYKGYTRFVPPNDVKPAANSETNRGANQTKQAGGPATGNSSTKRDAEMNPRSKPQPPRTSSASQSNGVK
jgi:TIGR03009 family protein